MPATLTTATTMMAISPPPPASIKLRNGLSSQPNVPTPSPVTTTQPGSLPEWIDSAPVLYYPLPAINSIIYHQHGHHPHRQWPTSSPALYQLGQQEVQAFFPAPSTSTTGSSGSSTSTKQRSRQSRRKPPPRGPTGQGHSSSQEGATMAENSDLNGVLESKAASEDQHLEDANGSANSSASSNVSDNSHHHLPVCRETIMLPKHIFEWSVADVGHWLTLNHFTAYNELLCERHRIDGRVLISLSAADLRAEPLSLTVFGDVKRLCLAISAVREYYSTVGSGDEDSEEVVLKHGHGHGHRKLTRPNRKSAKYNTKSHQVSDPNRPSRERISTRFRNGKVAPPLQNYPSVMSKSQSFPSYPRKQPQQSQPQADESTEDDYDLEPNGTEPLMYDEDDDGEDEIDEVEVLQEAPGQQQYLTRAVPPYPTQYTAVSADITPPNYYQTSGGSAPRRNSLSGSVSDSSSLSDSSEDSRQSSGSTSSTSISKCNSESTVSTAYPVASGTQEPIPINVYVQPQGSTGRPIAAQIIPKLTTSNQLANMANYYSQPPNAAPMFYQTGHQAVPPPTYPSHSSSYAPTSQTKKRSKGHHGHHHSHHRHGHGHHHHRKAEFKPEAWKAIVAMIYFFASTWVTAIVMVIVHDRVPDMDTYPPLPDILLDNLPLIPWAFGMCEFCGLVLFIIWSTILIFHKHRFILLRRMFSLFGSVFLLRCVTMLITSLSVPGRHLECKARPYGSWMERIHQAYLIWQGGGMSIQGVRTCGDYMFSGHTVVLTLMNFFITEYTPTKYYLVHTLSWVLNLFGIFFILAAHEHYSIDVFIAFYISTRLFLYYHTLANNRALYQRDRHRTRIWFPLFYFFESSVNGIVPNTYEVPFRKLKDRMVTYLSAKFSAGLAFGVPGLGGGCDRRHLMEDAAAASSASGSSSSSAGGPGSKVKTQ